MLSPWFISVAAISLTLLALVSLITGIQLRKTDPAGNGTVWGYVTVIEGPERGKVFPLRDDEIPVGRIGDPMHAVVLREDIQVSRIHGVIRRCDNAVTYEDSNSTNRSFLHGVDITGQPPIPITHGMQIRLGEHTSVKFSFEDGMSSQTEKAGQEPGFLLTGSG